MEILRCPHNRIPLSAMLTGPTGMQAFTYGVKLAAEVAGRTPRMTFNRLRDSNSGFFLEVYS
jgi:hypothetical protein